jgi:hypothetical protein
MMKLKTVATALALVVASQAHAQSTEGLFHPPALPSACNDRIGSLLISEGQMEQGEGSCSLSNPVSVGQGTRYTATCSAEGSSEVEDITLTPTATGITMQRRGFTFEWTRCN